MPLTSGGFYTGADVMRAAPDTTVEVTTVRLLSRCRPDIQRARSITAGAISVVSSTRIQMRPASTL